MRVETQAEMFAQTVKVIAQARERVSESQEAKHASRNLRMKAGFNRQESAVDRICRYWEENLGIRLKREHVRDSLQICAHSSSSS